MSADPQRKQIRKVRYCLVENAKYFEIDIYPEWKDKAILEIELNEEDESVTFPKGIDIIKEVTCDPEYFNYSLAKL